MEVRKKINIKNDLYYHILKWLNYDIFFWNLPEGDIKVFSEIYKKNYYLKKNVSGEKERMTLLFSKETLKEVQGKAKISYNTMHNALTRLRKKGLIKDNTIDERLCPDVLDRDEFTFTIKIKNIEEE